MQDERNIDAIVDAIMQSPRIPLATYRVQFHPEHFSFQDGVALVDYLHELGVTDFYASPLFKPRKGSMHGYDTVDYGEFNPALGTADDFDVLVNTLKAHDMGLLLDIVPNHMGVSTDNVWWTDVLKHGPSSAYAHYFDIDFRPRNRALDNKVLIPILGDHYGRVLEAGDIEVVYWHGDFYLHYYEHQFPLTPETYAVILQRAHAELLQADHEAWQDTELRSIIWALHKLPLYTTQDIDELAHRRREVIVIRWRLLALFDNSEAFREALTRALADLNGDPDDPDTFDALDDILRRQPYRLAYWRVAADEINYRRFFDINDMAAIRIEDPQVFMDTHRLTLRLMAEGKVTGLRIDHPDGLFNPTGYFRQLQEEYVLTTAEMQLGESVREMALVYDRINALAKSPDQPANWPVYVLIEKILSETEPLPYEWAVHGTTGYDFLNTVNNLFVDRNNEAAFDALYSRFTGYDVPFGDLIDRTKKQVMADALTSEIESRSAELDRIVEQNRRYRGLTRNSIAFALSEFIAALPIYRTYITGPGDVSERDRHYIEQAIEVARQRNPLKPDYLFDFIRDTLLMANLQDFSESQRADLREFVMKFQQITGPVMAKSVEDTAFYIYNRLTSLNEVGGHPDQFGIPVDGFHEHHLEQRFPYSMLCTSTHDTKRSEDVRARINVLSEVPGDWQHMLNEWAALNETYKTQLHDALAPTRNDEYLLYQTLIGSYPQEADDLTTYRDRIVGYMHKAINEAKVNSNWVNPNAAYQQAVTDFITRILNSEAFRASFEPFQERIAHFGRWNSLSQTLLKLASPGVPDIYQGNELWDDSLVDPDNRRPVDFEHRRALLSELKTAMQDDPTALASQLVSNADNGAIKLHVTHRALMVRQAHPDLFLQGRYIPLQVAGVKADHVCAFLLQHEATTALVVVPRLVYNLLNGETNAPIGSDVWHDTHLILPQSFDQFENKLTGEEVAVTEHNDQVVMWLSQALALFPVALLVQHTDDAS